MQPLPADTLQTVQTITALIFVGSFMAWIGVGREIPRYRGFIMAPLFYSLAVVAYYAMDYFFNPQVTVHSATIFTIASAWLRLVGGVLLLGVAVIIIADHRQRQNR